MKTRAQSSVEYMVMLGFLLVIIIALFMQAGMETSSKIRDTTAINAVERIAATANEVYRLGPGTKLYASVDMPPNIEGTYVGQNEVSITVNVPGVGNTDIVKYVDGTVTGKIPETQGGQVIPVEMLESGMIVVGCGLNLLPASLALTKTPGSLTDQDYNVSNGCSLTFANLTAGKGGAISSWITISSQPSGTLTPGQSSIFDTTINVPGGATPGTYRGYVYVSGSGAYDESPITITIPDSSVPMASDGAPTGTINETRPTISVYSSEPATCKGSINIDEPYASMDFTFSGSGTYHEHIPNSLTSSVKTVYVRCADASGNVMTSSYNWSFTVNVSSGETIIIPPEPPEGPPVVTLLSPANLSVLTSRQYNFQFKVTHPQSLTFSCNLLIKNATMAEKRYGDGGAYNDTATGIYSNSSLANGQYQWRVNCTNGYDWGVSASLSFTMAGPPHTITIPIHKDTFINSGQRTRNYGVYVTSNIPQLQCRVGTMNILIEPDMNWMPAGSTVTSATLYLYVQSLSNAGTYPLAAYRVSRSWLEGAANGAVPASNTLGATWLRYDGTNAWTSAGGDYDAAMSATASVSGAGWVSFDVTDMVNSWATGAYAASGFLIRVTSGTSGRGPNFYSSEAAGPATSLQPYLSVTYTS